MDQPSNQGHPITAAEFVDSLVKVGLVGMMVIMCFRVFSPFMNLMMWALILGVTLYPMHQTLAGKLGGRQGRAATVIVLAGMLLLGVPSVMLASSMADQLTNIHDSFQAGTLALRPPKDAVADWPVIGEKAHAAWTAAADNLPAFLEANRASIESFVSGGLAMAKSTASGIFMFLGSLVVAGIMMTHGKSGSQAMLSIFIRVSGPKNGPNVHTLATLTTRSVAVGVLGVAVIQAVIMGIGFLLAGVPAAGILALIVLLLAIMQLPAMLIGIPVILWLWNGGDASTTMNIVWTIYFLLAGLADNILKPILLGRGVDAPMPVILIGALGGMISTGFIGLFTGAVLLAVGYQLFMQWVKNHPTPDAAANEAAETGE